MTRMHVLLTLGVAFLGACNGSGGAQDSEESGIPATGDDDSGSGDGDPDDESEGGSSGGEEADAGDDPDSGDADEGPIHFDLDCDEPQLGAPVLRLLTREELGNTLDDIFPGIEGQWENALPANRVSEAGFDNAATVVVGNQTAEKLLQTAESVADAVTGPALANLLPCASSSPDGDCAATFVETFGRRLFRRPLTEAELDRYLGFFESAEGSSDFTTALKWVTVGLIQSPNAIYRSEIGTTAGGARELTPHEVVTELAYTYTSSTPSEALLELADAGDLGELSELVEDLLATDRGREAVQRFFAGYLSYTSVSAVGRPGVDGFSDVSPDMVAETRAFIESIVLSDEGGVRELLTSTTTHPSAELARYYGMPEPSQDYMSVERPSTHGVGVLAQGAFLASHASSDGSSPTRRGLFPFTRLLCQIKPPLPDDVPNITPPEPGVRTTRQRYEDIHAQAGSTCNTCHRLFDPIGFAFEHFDEGGRYRTNESGLPIDATGTILDPAGGTLFTFDGQRELMEGLVEQEVVYQCFSAYMATFAFGATDSCLAPSSAQALQEGEIGIVEAFAAIASEPHFTRRTAE